MSTEPSLKEIQNQWHGTMKSYSIGFFASLILTATSFLLVVTKAFQGRLLIEVIVVLAIVQAIVQLLFFLHVGQEAKPKWESFVFYFMLLILAIIVAGSLWIIFDLNERVMQMTTMEMPRD